MLPGMPRPVFTPVFLLGAATAVGVAYFYSILTRPDVPDWKRELDPGQHGFPQWFGGSGSYSPYDPPPPEGIEDITDVLLFIDLPMNSPSLPNAFYFYDILNARPDVSVRVTAPWSPEWNPAWDTTRNLRRAGCRQVLWRIGDGVGDVGDACPDATVIEELGAFSRAVPSITSRANITFLPEPQQLLSNEASHEALSAKFGSHWDMGLVAHVLPFADPAIFYPTRMNPTYRTITYFPHPSTPDAEWPKLPKGRQFKLYKQRSPPAPPDSVSPSLGDPFSKLSKFRWFWNGYDEQIAFSMARAGVCVFEGWQDGVLDARIAQAMLSGCMVATVPPSVEYGSLGHLILPLEKSDEAIPGAQIQAALAKLTDADIKKMLLQAFIFARQAFTGPARVDHQLELIQKWNAGARGYMFPHSFKWNCDTKGERPSWCPAE